MSTHATVVTTAVAFGAVLVIRQFRARLPCCGRRVETELTMTDRGELHGCALLTCPKCKSRYQITRVHEPDLFTGSWWTLDLARKEASS